MTAFAIPTWNGSSQGDQSRAIGEAARVIDSMMYKTRSHLKFDATARSSRALNDLMDMAEEYGIDANSSPAFARAKQFLLAMPSEIPAPELALDNDGEVVFDWINQRNEMLTVSLRADGRLSYAARRLPNEKEHGTKWFTGTLPSRIVSLVRDVNPRV